MTILLRLKLFSYLYLLIYWVLMYMSIAAELYSITVCIVTLKGGSREKTTIQGYALIEKKNVE